MQYHSTRGNAPCVDSAQAVLLGLAGDGGLYLPQEIPAFDWQKCVGANTLTMAEMILSALGIPASNAITMFYKQIVLNNGLPFEVKLPEHPRVAYPII